MTLKHHIVSAGPLIQASDLDSIDPSDGDRVRLWLPTSLTGAASPAIWELMYRATNPDGSANSSAYKWDFIGGAPIRAVINATEDWTTTGSPNGLWQNIPGGTAGPSITVPRVGDYFAEVTCEVTPNLVDGFFNGMSPQYGSAAVQDNDAAGHVNAHYSTVGRMSRGNVDPVGTIFARYQANAPSTTVSFRRRSLLVLPARLG
jgi:hypothetical protein